MLRSDTFIGNGAHALADIISRDAPTWLYRFNTTPDQTRATIAGSPHGTEIFYVFGTLERFRYRPGEISEEIERYLHR